MHKKISFTSLIILIIGAVDSIRNLPSSALFGSSLIFFFIFAAFIFLIPTALVSAELSAIFPEKGGIYYWVNRAFGPKTAMLAIWLQWINTVVWYPTILSFVAGSIAYLINPELISSPIYVISVVLTLFWGLTIVNLFGLRTSVKINEIMGVIGTIFPLLLLIVLGAAWFFSGNPVQISFHAKDLFPYWGNSATWVSLISIMASFLGMELAGVHVNDIENPQRNFPRAVLISTSFILFSMLFGSLAIAVVLPADNINLIAGVLQVFADIFTIFNIAWCTPLVAGLIAIGSIGTMINWLISPAKGLLHAAEFGFLPPLFTKKNRFGVASNILIAQAVLVSLFCAIFYLVPSVNAFYWFLTALSTGLYMKMYILMFLSALRLHYRFIDRPKSFKIPGKALGMGLIVTFGLIGCFLTIVVGYFVPDMIQIESKLKYALMILIGNILMISPVFLFYLYKRFKNTQAHIS
jgi:amino acid transporter